MKTIILILALLLIAGCTTTQYASGKTDISKVPDSVLISQGSEYAYFQHTIYAGPEKQSELSTIHNELKRRHPNWHWNEIVNAEITNGMTKNEVLWSWGPPAYKNSHSGSYGARDQWVYYRGSSARQYVYFEDGKVSGWGKSGI